MAADNNSPDSIAAVVTEVSESLTKLVQDEIELAKAEVWEKARSLMVGVGVVAAGAVFGVFAVVFLLLTLAWVFNDILVTGAGQLWLGFLIVFGVLIAMTIGSALFAWKKLKVGPPTPKMAIEEARKIRDTVSASAPEKQLNA